MTLFAAFIFLLAYYYFILRKYNTLGFRLFSLCFFVGAAMLFWWWRDWQELKRVERQGINTVAKVLQKKKEDSEYIVEVVFKDEKGNPANRMHKGGMSDEELAEIIPDQSIAIRYCPDADTFFPEKTFQRQNRDLSWFLLFPGFFLVLGMLAWFFLRQYRIHPHEGTVYEYMTNEEGKVVLDDAKNERTKYLKKWSLFYTMIQVLGRR